MSRIELIINKLISKFTRDPNSYINNFYRHKGVKIGLNTHIYTDIVSSEPYLISIGDNCTIATNVQLITHDASIGVFCGRDEKSDLCGRITIGNNCFVGSGSIILYGISIPDNTIVAAGSVVTKSPATEGLVIGGNPARPISTVENFLNKTEANQYSLHHLPYALRKETIVSNPEMLIKR